MVPSTTPTPEQPETFAQALARQQMRAADAKSRQQAHRDARRDGLSEAIIDQLFSISPIHRRAWELRTGARRLFGTTPKASA